MTKFGNTPTRNFASKLEEAVYLTQVWPLEKAGEITAQCQAHVYLTDARILYIPDFKCTVLKTGEEYFVEAKGFPSDRWPTIKKLWKYYGPGVLHIWGGRYTRPTHLETIIPKGKA